MKEERTREEGIRRCQRIHASGGPKGTRPPRGAGLRFFKPRRYLRGPCTTVCIAVLALACPPVRTAEPAPAELVLWSGKPQTLPVPPGTAWALKTPHGRVIVSGLPGAGKQDDPAPSILIPALEPGAELFASLSAGPISRSVRFLSPSPFFGLGCVFQKINANAAAEQIASLGGRILIPNQTPENKLPVVILRTDWPSGDIVKTLPANTSVFVFAPDNAKFRIPGCLRFTAENPDIPVKSSPGAVVLHDTEGKPVMSCSRLTAEYEGGRTVTILPPGFNFNNPADAASFLDTLPKSGGSTRSETKSSP